MVIDRHIHGAGTTEAAWRACEALQAVPFASPLDLVPLPRRAVVLAPHPDDEVLPCAGLLAALDVPFLVVAITDGEASHPGRNDRRRIRTRETREALARLGVTAEIIRLGLPDGEVEAHESALAARLETLIGPGDVVFAPWQWDGHPDHEATARAARTVADSAVIEMPIWGWHWAEPSKDVMPWRRAVRIAISPAIRERKRRAISAFESQCSGEKPILTAATLERFLRPYETFFR